MVARSQPAGYREPTAEQRATVDLWRLTGHQRRCLHWWWTLRARAIVLEVRAASLSLFVRKHLPAAVCEEVALNALT